MASDLQTQIEAAKTTADLAAVLRDLRRREASRRQGPELSYRQIAGRTGWSVAAVGAYLTGTRVPSSARFESLMEIVGADAEERAALGRARARVAETGRAADKGAVETPKVPDAGVPAMPGRAAPNTVPRTLPAPVVGFVGRETQLAVLDRVRSGSTKSTSAVISVLTGMAGVGKTALAVQWAHRVAPDFPEGQLYVDLHGYDSVKPLSTMDSLGALLSGLGVSRAKLPRDIAGRLAVYHSLLRDRTVLVVLDNAGGSEQVRPLLPPPPCVVVVTSRATLDDLDDAGSVRRVALDTLPEADATGLLRMLVGSRVDRELTAARALARHCGYLPLALRVAAEHIAARRDVALADLVVELEDIAVDLDAFEVPGDERADIRTVFSWSLRRLPEPAIALFRLVSQTPGPSIDRHGLAALADLTLSEIDRVAALLCGASLLRDRGGRRFWMHDLLRTYARELCERELPVQQRRAAVTRLLDHYLATGSAASDMQFPISRSTRPTWRPFAGKEATAAADFPDVGAASAWLAQERVNLVRACLFAAQQGWGRHAVALALLLRPVLDGGYDDDALAVHTAALTSALRLGDTCDATDRAGIRTGLGIANWRLGRHDEAVEQLRLAGDENLAAGNGGGAASTFAALGLVFDARGQYREAIDCQRRGLEIARAAGVRVQEAVQLINLGYGHLRIEEYQTSADLCRQAYEMFAGDGVPLGEAQARAGLAAALEGLGQYDEALAQAEEAVAINRSNGHAVYRLRAMATVGSIHRRLGRLDEARDRLTEALLDCRELNNPRPTANLLNTLGETCLSGGDYPGALANHAEALSLADRAGDRFEHSRALVGLGDAHVAKGDPMLARGYWQRAYETYAASGVPAAGRVQARLSAIAG